jgi:glycosyltransferase involved in cell wall biosynthesis
VRRPRRAVADRATVAWYDVSSIGMALTSIIIPTHDRPQLLQRAVESARHAGSDIEIVVVEDGSSTETAAVCRSLRDVTLVRLERCRGVGHARAAGIAASSGTYISLLDDDDVRLPGSIDRQLALLDARPKAALVYGQVYLASQNLAIDSRRVFPRECPTGEVYWALMGGNFIASCAVVVRRSAIEAVGGWCGDTAPADDWDLWLRLAEHYPVAALAEPVSVYREPTLWSNQGSSRLADTLLPADLRVLQRCADSPRAKSAPRAFRNANRRVMRAICVRLLADAFEAARRGDSYALVSLRHAVAAPEALLEAVFSMGSWKKLKARLAS